MGSTTDLVLTEYHKPQTAIEIRAHVNLIQEVMRAVMKENTHYGVIPGCQKPSLWKPGAEVLFATFRVSVDPMVEDLSGPEEARFRVTAHGSSASGLRLGSAVGEASSDEEKYKWREVVCTEEWDATPEDHRRTKWKRGKQGAWSIQQIRTNIADCRNTVLKMAAKRAIVALALQVTAASDIFTQDIEDVPEEAREAVVEAPTPLPTEIKKKAPESAPASVLPSQPTWCECGHISGQHGAQAPHICACDGNVNGSVCPCRAFRAKQAARSTASDQGKHPPIQSPKPSNVRVISEAQSRRFYAMYMQHGRTQREVVDFLTGLCGVGDSRQIPVQLYERACKWAETGEDF